MTLQACADLVARGGREGFAAIMAAPVEARRILFPVQAFALEVARAPWASEEPMIAQMRLQFWRDVLEEAEAGKARAHEVAAPLAEAVAEGVPVAPLMACVDAREWDVGREPFADEPAFWDYLDATGGGLVWASAAALGAGAEAEAGLRGWGRGAALARYFQAVPELEGRGRMPLVDGRPEAVKRLADEGLAAMTSGSVCRGELGTAASSPMLLGAMAPVLLRKVQNAPGRVAAGALEMSEFRKRFRLMRMAATPAWRM
ncbi:squalene/phytoene synthase family protein [Oceanicola sp. 502str15]|uniref:squalene/phytoene synthase family protein n=1 Tax=Oceanicola sp. 502str15 TaxID=2696061 RepID=UPI0020960FFD|nr:squalene/phytoene synthase family protein [Oceanicola sp. 502str15]MCO6382287.1 squalene/phytoene synthase family protein [Oceanicola sp. 502str15]